MLAIYQLTMPYLAACLPSIRIVDITRFTTLGHPETPGTSDLYLMEFTTFLSELSYFEEAYKIWERSGSAL